MLKAPCRHCIQREIGCHSKCKLYAKYMQDNEKIKLKKRAELDINGYIKGEIYKNWKSRLGTSKRINLREH